MSWRSPQSAAVAATEWSGEEYKASKCQSGYSGRLVRRGWAQESSWRTKFVIFKDENAVYLTNRLEVGKDGKTAHEKCRGKRATVMAIEIGEKLENRLVTHNPRWEYGVFVGLNATSGEVWAADLGGHQRGSASSEVRENPCARAVAREPQLFRQACAVEQKCMVPRARPEVASCDSGRLAIRDEDCGGLARCGARGPRGRLHGLQRFLRPAYSPLPPKTWMRRTTWLAKARSYSRGCGTPPDILRLRALLAADPVMYEVEGVRIGEDECRSPTGAPESAAQRTRIV